MHNTSHIEIEAIECSVTSGICFGYICMGKTCIAFNGDFCGASWTSLHYRLFLLSGYVVNLITHITLSTNKGLVNEH